MEFGRRFLAEFYQRWGMLTIWPDVDDFKALAYEALTINLQRSRAMTRLNHSMRYMMEGRASWPKAVREHDLADLYLNRLDGRERRLEAELEAGLTRMRERAERLSVGTLHAIEMFVAGKKAAAEEAARPRRPIVDEFADREEPITVVAGP